MHQVADMVADYLEQIEDYPVLPATRPGEVAALLPTSAPEQGEPIDAILADFATTITPHTTHWNHPGFMAYIANTASGPGILGETLAAALNANAMLWRTSPVATELEERVCDWVRQLVDLPPVFRGHINDTASIGVLLALAAARDRAAPDVRSVGLSGEHLVVYTSDQAHSSVDKAAITLGLGLDQVRRIPSDGSFRMDVEALADTVRREASRGVTPIAIVATAGTTSTGSLDPLEGVAAVAREHGAWFHVDAAYGGGAAVLPEVRAKFAGIEHADSIVINPHKWLFTPVDCSILYLRDPAALKAAFALVPAYLKTTDPGVTNLMDFGPQLGRRFRALKLWMVLRSFGAEGLRSRIGEHLRLAKQLADAVDADPAFARVAPVELGIVAFRCLSGGSPEDDDALAMRVIAEVNARGDVFLSHSVLGGRTVLRVVVGNIRTTERHVTAAWDQIRSIAAALRAP
ncbi:MAG: aminotransferase class I/II-fold pyridoxal phosphate-dependent enzyme [Myxococcota bacterium]